MTNPYLAPKGDHGILEVLQGEPIDLRDPIEATADDHGQNCKYFRDTREGVDRWGTPYKGKWACGTGFGPDQYVCPLYVEESCPGCKNKGNRAFACYRQNCGLACGFCGGGGEKLSQTMGYCGQEKGSDFTKGAMGEFGAGTLRLDRYVAPPPPINDDELPVRFPVSYFPVVEWGGRKWMQKLGDPEYLESKGLDPNPYPMIGTTMKTVFPGRRMKRVTPLRERLGGYEGTLLVNGLTKDDLLDDVWADRKRVQRFCYESGTDLMVTPQYSAYPQYMNFMMVYNTNRVFTWYQECLDMGFKYVALDVPPNFHARWILDEYFRFINDSKVKLIALSYQQFRARGGMDPRTIWNARLVHKSIPPDVSVIIFGPSTMSRIMTMARCFPGRRVIFSTVEAYARSAFFQLIPFGTSAPAGMAKEEVFCRNVHSMRAIADKVMTKFDQRPPAPLPGPPKKDPVAAAKRREERRAKMLEKKAAGKLGKKKKRQVGQSKGGTNWWA